MMTYFAVKDLKRTRQLWETLCQEREIVVTKDGMPCAILVEVSPDRVEETLAAIRRAIFSTAVTRARRRARENPAPPDRIEDEIRRSRRNRGLL